MGSADAMVNKTLQYIASVVGGTGIIQVLQGSFVPPTDLSRSRAGRVAEWFKAPVLKVARLCISRYVAVSPRQVFPAIFAAGHCYSSGQYRPIRPCWVQSWVPGIHIRRAPILSQFEFSSSFLIARPMI
jgi:hypothetical protein